MLKYHYLHCDGLNLQVNGNTAYQGGGINVQFNALTMTRSTVVIVVQG